MKRLTIKHAKQLAIKKGGKCLSKTYINNKTKMVWECKHGHQWKAIYSQIKNGGHWCPICATVKSKISIVDCQKLAKSRGGKCLSKRYYKYTKKLEWQCKYKHIWNTSYKEVKSGSWCPICAGKVKKTIEDCRELALKRGGRCLSKIYVNNITKLTWSCQKNHKWKAKYNDIQQGHWCPYCSGHAKPTVEDCKKLALKNNGKCLSKTYTNNKAKMVWECNKQHRWETSYKVINKGAWCPYCASGKTQRLLTQILSKVVGERPICNYRPEWMKNPQTGHSLEIDIYFPKSKIAIEYNGIQHYKQVFFAKNISKHHTLSEIKKRDKIKKRLIKRHPDKVKYFAIFTYRNIVKENNIRHILKSQGIIK